MNPFESLPKKNENNDNDLNEGAIEHIEKKLEIITLSDTHNDVEAIKENLRLYNIVDGDGKWNSNIENIKIIHTGDLVNKQDPDLTSLRYMRELKDTAPKSCSVEMIAGNHEIDVLQNKPFVIQDPYIEEDIEHMKVLHYDEPVLFMHGYPTRELLETLLTYTDTEEGVAELNRLFEQSATEAMQGDPRNISYFSYQKKNDITGKKNIFRDIKPEKYYEKRGEEISDLLDQLGIKIIIHGHKPVKDGVQAKHEFHKHIQGATLIDNDCAVSRTKQDDRKESKVNHYGSVRVTINNPGDPGSDVELHYKNKKHHGVTDLQAGQDHLMAA